MAERIYTEGKIVVFMWGYDQTNIDYFLITKRTKVFVTLQPIGNKETYNAATMTGTCLPDPGVTLGKSPIRRKVAVNNGEEIGIAIKSYGWANLWDGMPSHYSSYG